MKKRKRGMAMLIVVIAMVVLSSFGVLMTTNALYVQNKVAVSALGKLEADAIGEYFVANANKLSAEQRADVYQSLTAEGGAFCAANTANPYKNFAVYTNSGDNAVPSGDSAPSDYLVIEGNATSCDIWAYRSTKLALHVQLVSNAGQYKINKWTYIAN